MKIGFIDYDLNNYHANKFLSIFGKELAGESLQVVAAWESNPTGEDWCAKNGIKRAASAEEVVAAADAVMIIAPDFIEHHLELARPALESKKPVFLDKQLATQLDDAREIVRIAEKHTTPIMSSTSLRFAVEMEELVKKAPGPYATVMARGFGKWHGYACHTVTPALRLFGTGAKRLVDTGRGGVRMVTLDDGERRCTIEMREAENQDAITPWQFGVLVGNQYEFVTVTQYHEFYVNEMRETIQFFKTGKSPISTREMLMTVAIENLSDESIRCGGKWLDVACE